MIQYKALPSKCNFSINIGNQLTAEDPSYYNPILYRYAGVMNKKNKKVKYVHFSNLKQIKFLDKDKELIAKTGQFRDNSELLGYVKGFLDAQSH